MTSKATTYRSVFPEQKGKNRPLPMVSGALIVTANHATHFPAGNALLPVVNRSLVYTDPLDHVHPGDNELLLPPMAMSAYGVAFGHVDPGVTTGSLMPAVVDGEVRLQHPIAGDRIDDRIYLVCAMTNLKLGMNSKGPGENIAGLGSTEDFDINDCRWQLFLFRGPPPSSLMTGRVIKGGTTYKWIGSSAFVGLLHVVDVIPQPRTRWDDVHYKSIGMGFGIEDHNNASGVLFSDIEKLVPEIHKSCTQCPYVTIDFCPGPAIVGSSVILSDFLLAVKDPWTASSIGDAKFVLGHVFLGLHPHGANKDMIGRVMMEMAIEAAQSGKKRNRRSFPSAAAGARKVPRRSGGAPGGAPGLGGPSDDEAEQPDPIPDSDGKQGPPTEEEMDKKRESDLRIAQGGLHFMSAILADVRKASEKAVEREAVSPKEAQAVNDHVDSLTRRIGDIIIDIAAIDRAIGSSGSVTAHRAAVDNAIKSAKKVVIDVFKTFGPETAFGAEIKHRAEDLFQMVETSFSQPLGTLIRQSPTTKMGKLSIAASKIARFAPDYVN